MVSQPWQLLSWQLPVGAAGEGSQNDVVDNSSAAAGLQPVHRRVDSRVNLCGLLGGPRATHQWPSWRVIYDLWAFHYQLDVPDILQAFQLINPAVGSSYLYIIADCLQTI